MIVNPVSGRGKACKIASKIFNKLQVLGFNVDLQQTQRPKDASRYASEISKKELILAVGGDGTVHEVLNGLADLETPIGMIPAGMSNVLARELKLPRTLSGCIQMLNSGMIRRLDTGIDRISGRRFLMMSGAGFNAAIVYELTKTRTGTITYLDYILKGLKVLFKDPLPKISVTVDGRLITRSASLVEIGNVRSYGGPLLFNPRAETGDGWLDLFIFNGQRRVDIFVLFGLILLNYLTNGMIPVPKSILLKGKQILLSATDKVYVHMDGDPAGLLPILIEVSSQASVLVPYRP